MSSPYVNFKSICKTVTEVETLLIARATTIIDSIRVSNLSDRASEVRLYIRKYKEGIKWSNTELYTIESHTSVTIIKNPIACDEAKEILQGSLLYLDINDILAFSLKYEDRGSVLVSYRELLMEKENNV